MTFKKKKISILSFDQFYIQQVFKFHSFIPVLCVSDSPSLKTDICSLVPVSFLMHMQWSMAVWKKNCIYPTEN